VAKAWGDECGVGFGSCGLGGWVRGAWGVEWVMDFVGWMGDEGLVLCHIGLGCFCAVIATPTCRSCFDFSCYCFPHSFPRNIMHHSTTPFFIHCSSPSHDIILQPLHPSPNPPPHHPLSPSNPIHQPHTSPNPIPTKPFPTPLPPLHPFPPLQSQTPPKNPPRPLPLLIKPPKILLPAALDAPFP